MDNKEVIDRLVEYYLSQDPKIVARALACALIDFNRIWHLHDLPGEERDCLFARIAANCQELHSFIENGPRCDLKLHNMQCAEDVRNAIFGKKEEEE